MLQHHDGRAIGNHWNGRAVAQSCWPKTSKATTGRICQLISPLIAGLFLFCDDAHGSYFHGMLQGVGGS
jgi:hypothetical protein